MGVATSDKQTPKSSSNPSEVQSIEPSPWGSTFSALSPLVWIGILALPLALTYNDLHKQIFPPSVKGLPNDPAAWPSAVGLCLGISTVAVGQFFVVFYHYLRCNGFLDVPLAVQTQGPSPYVFGSALRSHLWQLEGFVLIGGYLTITWMFRLLPESYYSFEGGIQWHLVLLQLLLQDGLQYLMHRAEHKVHPTFYQWSHKPHHRFLNPKMFDAFHGSFMDTVTMILIPLFTTANIVKCNVWSYMAFGSLYANWLVMIHNEYSHPWDPFFRCLGLGTAADHHVHHKLFIWNYGHLFMYWDRLAGTYKDPDAVKQFNKGV